MGRGGPHGQRRSSGGPASHRDGAAGLSDRPSDQLGDQLRDQLQDELDGVFREHWWAAVAVITRLAGGDLEIAEDAVQDACAAALTQWPSSGIPASPRAWLVSVARHKLLDRIRRESRRPAKELAALAGGGDPAAAGQRAAARAADDPLTAADDQLALIFMCCHPALDPVVRVALTLRSVCGLSTGQIAAGFLVPEATMAQRLVRAKRKIRQAGIPMLVPSGPELGGRLSSVFALSTWSLPRGTWPLAAASWSAATSATRRSGWPGPSRSCCPASRR